MSREDDFADKDEPWPTRAEAPQVEVISSGPPDRSLAEILRNPPRLHMEAPQGEICNVCDRLGPMACSDHAAAQPETVDGGRVREIAERIYRDVKPGNVFTDLIAAIRAGFAAGRAAENEACEKLARQHVPADYNKDWQEACEAVADAIAARRGGGR